LALEGVREGLGGLVHSRQQVNKKMSFKQNIVMFGFGKEEKRRKKVRLPATEEEVKVIARGRHGPRKKEIVYREAQEAAPYKND